MHIKKFRWSQVYESSEEELIELLKKRNLSGERKHIVAGEEQGEQHETVVTIWCAEGSLTFKADLVHKSLQPGDAVRIELGKPYVLYAGIAGCVYYITQ